ncbi:hypothetical protein BH10ACI1_BH10ACI1_13640 [soil metagenome]
MKKLAFFLSPLFFIALFINPLYPCAESYIVPVFQYSYAPENPYGNFANGKIGIIKPTYRRVVLYAAYRFLNNGSFSADEQKALVEVWNAEFRNEEPTTTNVNEIVKKWLEKRKEIAENEENLPSIYVERRWGGYSFFPNCNINAFETAIETLSDRISIYGTEDKNVSEWLKGQDAVFANCASGKNIPSELGAEFPVWLRKDREYQIAAAEFYSLNFDDARKRFEAIALDSDSVWHETAKYLVGRTLIRQASFTKDATERKRLYEAAENHFLLKRGSKFYESEQKLVNLIKIKIRPEQRTRELAQSLLYQQYGEQLQQDLIDYTWLLDKFETEILKTEEKRKDDAEISKFADSDRIMLETISANLAKIGVSIEVSVLKGEVTLNGKVPGEKYDQILAIVNKNNPRIVTNNLTRVTENADGSITYQGGNFPTFFDEAQLKKREQIEKGEIFEFWLDVPVNNLIPNDSNTGSATVSTSYFTFDPKLTDEEIFASVEKSLERNLTEKEKETIREARQDSFRYKYSNKATSDYEGGYNGKETISTRLLPEFLRGDELTDWLFTFQIQDESAYLHALEKWQQSNADLWLTTALVKANKDSKNINQLLERAIKLNRNSPAFPTVAYHMARIFIEQEKLTDARKLLDEVLGSNLDLPISTRNEFAELRMKIAGTLDDFLKNATRKPFTFADYDESVTIDEVIQQQKDWWSSDYNTTKAEWDKQIEEQFADYKIWEKREMFDAETVKIINENFPLSVLLEAQKSSELPEYLREKLAFVIWTRAVLLEDQAILQKIAPEVLKFAPEVEDFLAAKSPQELRFAALYVLYKHDYFVPYLESGFRQVYASDEQANGWWCSPSEYDYDEEYNEIPRRIPNKPPFITKEQNNSAQIEMKKLKTIGDAPTFLGEKALEWFKIAPKDKRLPEILYIAYLANERYIDGCGNREMLGKLANLLRNNFPDNEWTKEIKRK